MESVEYEIKRLEEFYKPYSNRVEQNKGDWWHKILKDIILPHYDTKLGELYSLRDMQIQHTNKLKEELYRSINPSTKYIINKPHQTEPKPKTMYAVKAPTPEPRENVLH